MATVNDLMIYLNNRFGLSLPTLPLPIATKTFTGWWKAIVSNWTPAENPPSVVEIEAEPGLTLDVAGGKLVVLKGAILIQAPSPSTVKGDAIMGDKSVTPEQ